MTGPKGNSDFCFPETSMGNIEVRGETLNIPPDSKLEKNCEKISTVTVPAVRAAVKPRCPTETTR